MVLTIIPGDNQQTCGGEWRLAAYNLTADAMKGSTYHLSCMKPNHFIKIGDVSTELETMRLSCGFE